MNFVLNMLLRVLLVFLLVPLNKLKGKVFIHVYIDGNRIVFRDGIYPSWNCSFDIYEGAHNNLPDSAAMTTAQRIQTMIANTMCADDVLLVLISGKILYTEHGL